MVLFTTAACELVRERLSSWDRTAQNFPSTQHTLRGHPPWQYKKQHTQQMQYSRESRRGGAESESCEAESEASASREA